MYNLIFILFCITISISIKISNLDIETKPKILARSWGTVKRGIFTYFNLTFHGPIILNLTSFTGDADLYISDSNIYPTYDSETYTLNSATCGQDVIEMPDSIQSPLAVGIYGYAESSDFFLEITENLKLNYPYKKWVIIEQDMTNNYLKNDGVNTKKAINAEGSKKKKQKHSSSDVSALFPVLEVLQLIFL